MGKEIKLVATLYTPVIHCIINCFLFRFTDDGVRYFVDHNTRTTTFDDPRPGAAKQVAHSGGVALHCTVSF